MKDGIIQQIGTPEDIYNEPINRFTASFIGESNIIDGVMKKDFLVSFEGFDYKCVDKGFKKDEAIDVVIRPEDIVLSTPREETFCGTVTDIIFKGVHYEICVDVNGKEYVIHSIRSREIGDEVSINFSPEDIHVMRKVNVKA